MSRHTLARIAWVLFALSSALALLDGFALVANGPRTSGNQGGGPALAIVFPVALLAFGLVGALIASRRPANPIGWLFSGTAFLVTLGSAADAYAQRALFVAPGSLPGGLVMAWFSRLVQGPILFAVFTFLFLLFPNGRPLSPRWRTVAWLAAGLAVVGLFLYGFGPGPLDNSDFDRFANPFGLPALAPLGNALAGPIFLLTLAFVALSAASLVLRFRRSTREEREQIKWLASAGAFIGLVFLAGPVIWLTPALENTLLWPVLFLAAFVSLPLSVGVAILKYHLYDIDLIIRRTLVYGTLTVVLGVIYLSSVVLLQELFRALTGQSSDVAVVISTLAIAALFAPLRRRVQEGMDLRFYRRKFDAQQVMTQFAASAREKTDLRELTDELLAVAQQTMQPASASVWLRKPGQERRQ